MAIIKELQKVAPFGRIENREPPVVEDEELNATDGFEQAAIAAVASSEGERLEQARDAMILDRAIVAASFVTEGASNPAFAQPGCPCDEQVLIAVDPITADQPGEDGAVDAAWRAPIEVFHACALAQRGELETGRETFGVALGGFAIDPTRSSNDRAPRSGDRRCSWRALAIPVKPSVISRSWVGCVSIEGSMVQWK